MPENDPTLMFANSGMVQFKNIFTGKEIREYSRAVTAQKCVRAGGKHNDLENVGYTTRHHTFFEMLGNFSFGDYFKDLAIELAWNLITKEYGIDKNKLVVTVFEEDMEAYDLWKKISGLKDDKIIKINTSDNFWSMGDTGPCGPCSEIFYDNGDKFFGGTPGSKDEEGDRFTEIWNLVFMQYYQIQKGKYKLLPQNSIDTGMGLERITMVLQNKKSVFEIDSFQDIIEKIEDLSGKSYKNNKKSFRIVLDHLKSAVFLISDGVLPAKEDRGYVLRRLLRSSIRHSSKLELGKDGIKEIVKKIILVYEKDYPEIKEKKKEILKIIEEEKTKFEKTLTHGLKIFEELISENKLSNKEIGRAHV